MRFQKENIKYFDLIVSIIAAYIIIKVIDNYSYMLAGFDKIKSIISPFIYAFIIAYVLNPIMKFFEKKCKLKRGISILFTYVFIIGLMTIFSIYLLPKIYSNILDIAKNLPAIATEAQNRFNNFINNENIKGITGASGLSKFDANFIVSKFSNMLMSGLNVALSKTWTFTSYFIKWIFGLIIAIYVLYDKEKFIEISKKMVYIVLKEKNGGRFIRFFKNIDHMIGTYIGIKAIDSLIIGMMAFIGLTILRSPYALLIAVFVGITNMIPYFGPFMGMLVGFIINLFFSPIKAVFVFLFLFLLQQFDGWYLDPKLIGGKVGLSPFLVIFAVTLGGGLYGPIGMILAVPTMAVIKIYTDKLMVIYNRSQGKREKEEKVIVNKTLNNSVSK